MSGGRTQRVLEAAVGAWAVAGALDCGAAAKPPTTVFDPSGTPTSAAPVDVTAASDIERPYPPLDGAVGGEKPWVGVSVLHDEVHLARPPRWALRDAGGEPGHSFVRYVSPEAYSFAIYERADAPSSSWHDIMANYELDVAGNGAKLAGQRTPVATLANQGRAYTVDRKIEGKDAVLSRSREILLRGAHRVVLVQVVTSEPDLSRIDVELVAVLRNLQVM